MAEESGKYRGNSKADREAQVPKITSMPSEDEPQQLDAVISEGKATLKKPSLGKRLRQNFVGEDAQTLGSYIFLEIVVPSVKSLVIDVVQQGIVRAVGGNPGPSRRIPGSQQYTPYSAISTSKAMKPDPREPASSAMRPLTYDQIVFDDRGTAEVVRDRMFDQVREYGVVTVANLYDFAAITNIDFQANKWGWDADSLRMMTVQGTLRNGYFLNLPRPVAI